jgi:hypothetical protein
MYRNYLKHIINYPTCKPINSFSIFSKNLIQQYPKNISNKYFSSINESTIIQKIDILKNTDKIYDDEIHDIKIYDNKIHDNKNHNNKNHNNSTCDNMIRDDELYDYQNNEFYNKLDEEIDDNKIYDDEIHDNELNENKIYDDTTDNNKKKFFNLIYIAINLICMTVYSILYGIMFYIIIELFYLTNKTMIGNNMVFGKEQNKNSFPLNR